MSSLNPTECTLKYADDTTVYCPVYKSSVEVKHKSGHKRTVRLPNNTMQTVADAASEWSREHHQRLNAGKTQYMMFTPQLNLHLDTPVKIANQDVTQTQTAKLLGITFDTHLKFAAHVDASIHKTRSAVHGLLTLKRNGVRKHMLSRKFAFG